MDLALAGLWAAVLVVFLAVYLGWPARSGRSSSEAGYDTFDAEDPPGHHPTDSHEHDASDHD
jgi:hypothetical protein